MGDRPIPALMRHPCSERNRLLNVNRRISYSSQKKYDDSYDCYTKTIRIDPLCYRAYANRGMILHRVRKKYRDAALDFQAALLHGPTGWTIRPRIEKLPESARKETEHD